MALRLIDYWLVHDNGQGPENIAYTQPTSHDMTWLAIRTFQDGKVSENAISIYCNGLSAIYRLVVRR